MGISWASREIDYLNDCACLGGDGVQIVTLAQTGCVNYCWKKVLSVAQEACKADWKESVCLFCLDLYGSWNWEHVGCLVNLSREGVVTIINCPSREPQSSPGYAGSGAVVRTSTSCSPGQPSEPGAAVCSLYPDDLFVWLLQILKSTHTYCQCIWLARLFVYLTSETCIFYVC